MTLHSIIIIIMNVTVSINGSTGHFAYETLRLYSLDSSLTGFHLVYGHRLVSYKRKAKMG